jgi:hypothetical protein
MCGICRQRQQHRRSGDCRTAGACHVTTHRRLLKTLLDE